MDKQMVYQIEVVFPLPLDSTALCAALTAVPGVQRATVINFKVARVKE